MLDQGQLDQFHRQGFLVLRQVFGGDELDLLRLAADRVEADGVAGLGQHHHYHTLAGGAAIYRGSGQLWDRDPIFPAATVHPRLLEAIGQCLGHPFLPVADTFTCQIRFGKLPIPWHQAPPYSDPGRQHTFALPNFEAGICLDHATADNGCLWVLPGHHLAGHIELERGAEEEFYAQACPIEMAPGDVLFLCPSLPRAARGNSSPRTWRIFHIGFAARQEGQQNPTLARLMLEKRRQLGLADPESAHVVLGDEGFTFVAAGR